MIKNGEQMRIRKEAVVICLKEIFRLETLRKNMKDFTEDR
jgi:hypothetical protein